MLNTLESRLVRIAPRALSLAVGLSVIGTAFAAAGSVEAASGGVRCEIQVKDKAGGVALEGIVTNSSAIDGTYQLVISKSGGGGSSDIKQSGAFSSKAGQDTSLGTVMLGGDGGHYTAKLKVLWDGRSTECREKVRGSF